MPELLSGDALARLLGVTGQAVRKAHAAGRLSSIGGKFDPEVAKIQWERNRKRRRADPPPIKPAGAEQGTGVESQVEDVGTGYWQSKARREAAEASIAELREAELRGDLVRKAEIERALASRLVALRESLEVLADRLASLVAAETDPQVCRRMIRDEHRQALAAFASRLDEPLEEEEAADGGA